MGRTAPGNGVSWAAPLLSSPALRGVRQHVNPLGLHFQVPRATRVNAPASMPPGAQTEVELGCADGKFSFDLAQASPDTFVVGLEIREPLVERNEGIARREGIDNLRFAYVNLNVDLDRVFPPASVDRFHLLFPDPHFKQRHRKRRVVDLDFCQVIARQLRPGGELHVATDIFDLALDAMAELEEPACEALGLRSVAGPWSFVRGNPYPVTSRREDTTVARGQRVWRLVYRLEG